VIVTDQTTITSNQGLVGVATVAAEVSWHLTETMTALRAEAAPLSPELLRVVLRGLAELCGLLVERGGEGPARPPTLFRDDQVVAEALGMWEGRLRFAMTEQGRAASAKQHRHGEDSHE